MYRVKSIMGDTVFQVLDGMYVIRSFYTEQAAKEFADRLNTEQYFNIHKKENGDMDNEMKKCVIIETDLPDVFEDMMNENLNKGYKVESSSCNSEYYKAIMILEDKE